jgi:hypothetical protein
MNRDKLVILLGVLLFLSLTGNVFVGSLLLGEAYSPAGGEEHHGDWKKKEALLRGALAPADQAALTLATKGKHEQFHTMHDALEAARQRVEDAQNREPFDPKGLDAALEDEKQKKSALLKLIRQTHEEIAQRLSPGGREIFGKIVREDPSPAPKMKPAAGNNKPAAGE